MCGIAGFLNSSDDLAHERMGDWVGRMTDTLAHRGPDDRGTWSDPAAGVALGSRRLAIIDVSPEGHQPMASASGRYSIAYNGEVYNAAELATALERASLAPKWHGHSDTEVLLAAFEAWGFERALASMNGMFAFALWDAERRTLHLTRDRLGIKPLYAGLVGDSLVFGSELHAIAAHPRFDARIDRIWVDRYLRGTRTPSTRTIYDGIRSIRPGTHVAVTAPTHQVEHVYWSAIDQAERGHAEPFTGDLTEATTALSEILRDAVRLRMVSDVPLGVLLSGGIDSATVLALLQADSRDRVRSFSIGFPDPRLDEAPDARAIASHVGSAHTELYVTPEDILAVIPSISRRCDQPMSDPSFVSNYCAYRLAGRHVTVALTGDGGDEVFGGYHRHRWLQRVWRAAGWTPAAMRNLVAQALTSVAPATWDKTFASVQALVPAKLHERSPGAKIQRLARWVAAATPEEMYGVLASKWEPDDDLVVANGHASGVADAGLTAPDGGFSLTERVMAHELITYLPDGQLTKVDRASMAVSVEARVPLLDHRVVEFALRLPLDTKVRGDTGKFILRQVLHQHVPPHLFERPKMGFQLPLSTWLRGPLRAWAEDLLDADRITRGGLLRAEPIHVKWREHLSGRRDRVDHLWPVLMLQAWLEGHRS